MDISAFGEPWEQIRLLSDSKRNGIIRELLQRRARGARILEVGCGHGVWACVAARLGATRVMAVEATGMADLAHDLVKANGLEHIVTVRQGMIEDLEPEPMDLVFSELLNADPFQEGVVGAMASASQWLAPGAHLAPRRLRVWVALARDRGSSNEFKGSMDELHMLAHNFDLNLEPATELLSRPGPYRYVASVARAITRPTLLFDLDLSEGRRPPKRRTVTIEVDEPGPASAAVAWFEAEYDDGLTLSNPPGEAGHWGNLICSWPQEIALRAGQKFSLLAEMTEDGLLLSPKE